MALREHFESSGAWLFRWRSYLPLLLLFLILIGLRNFHDLAADPRLENVWTFICFAIGVLGLMLRAFVVGYAAHGTSGRNARAQQADALNTSGLYSVVRHPLYLGNYLMWLSATLLTNTVWLPIVVSLIFWLYYERIMSAEEAFLRAKFGATFEQWAARTPAFVPAFQGWRASALPFNVRRVLRQERAGLLALVLIFCAFNAFVNYSRGNHFALDRAWQVILALTLLCYIIFTIDKKLARRARKKEPATSSIAGSNL
jgi:protein-S-isoprenylcysteine O-methyltransferase Ste14